jgi:hypothetical protein
LGRLGAAGGRGVREIAYEHGHGGGGECRGDANRPSWGLPGRGQTKNRARVTRRNKSRGPKRKSRLTKSSAEGGLGAAAS